MPTITHESNFLRNKRLELGLRPTEVASMIGVSPETYRYWESRGELPQGWFPQIAAALNISIDELKAEATVAA
jgi:transcriptional regulator with XRE-family HTH domain